MTRILVIVVRISSGSKVFAKGYKRQRGLGVSGLLTLSLSADEARTTIVSGETIAPGENRNDGGMDRPDDRIAAEAIVVAGERLQVRGKRSEESGSIPYGASS